MKKSKDILGLWAREFAHVIAKRRGYSINDEVAGDLLEAEVNHGRWIVRCPYCTGAEIADPDSPLFICLSCFNAANDRRFIPVKFPEDRVAIENELSKRKKEDNQNWIPGETLNDLKAETRKRGAE